MKDFTPIDTNIKEFMSTTEYAQYLTALTGKRYDSNAITYMCRNNKLPQGASGYQDSEGGVWHIQLNTRLVTAEEYNELANMYKDLLARCTTIKQLLD